MGNGKSQPAGLIIEDSSFQSENFWSLHPATYGTQPSKKVTVFVGPPDSSDNVTALERFAKNLMLHRHPNILKYVASWKVNGQYHLATEEVQPLSQVLNKQVPLQVCIGLHSILKALTFLHEKAESSHNNVCQAAVYVTSEGQWKLGGFEYLCPFNNVSAGFLAESRAGRYERGVSPEEANKVPQPLCAIDQYAYGILVEEILSKINGEVAGIKEFLDVCRNGLLSQDCANRPPLYKLLEHQFFSHQFIKIHNFLTELPLKTELEKQDFFSELVLKLREYSEVVVGAQLGSLLLSRLVLLDRTAQHHLLPKLLCPTSEVNGDGLLSEATFRSEMVPRLMSIFSVRDVQVRLTLLSYFPSYCTAFTLHQLQSILPELLLGIKDTNDTLVAATLKALADIVPLLGSATVIGGKRMKLFSDGRPKAQETVRQGEAPPAESLPSHPVLIDERLLSERHSPDGGETFSMTTVADDDWHQWDSLTPSSTPLDSCVSCSNSPLTHSALRDPVAATEASVTPAGPVSPPSKAEAEGKPPLEEVDFFCDMEPVISKASVLRLEEETTSKFTMSDCEGEMEAWGADLEWAHVNQDSH